MLADDAVQGGVLRLAAAVSPGDGTGGHARFPLEAQGREGPGRVRSLAGCAVHGQARPAGFMPDGGRGGTDASSSVRGAVPAAAEGDAHRSVVVGREGTVFAHIRLLDGQTGTQGNGS